MIEATVLTGFLGSGKTTLLGHLLRQPEFSRTAVIINEFGEIGLDHDLVEASEESVIELQTGCLCCKIRNDLATTVYDLLRRRDEGSVTPFTRVVIETSGLADPAPILQTLMTEATIAGRIALGGVVATVDAVNGAATLRREEISVKQVAVADRVVLTKTDLAGPTQHALMRRLEALNATAPVLSAQQGQIDPARLFGGRLYDTFTKSLDVQSWLRAQAAPHGHANRHHDIDTYAIVRRDPIRAVTLTLFLEALAEHCGADLLRLKGIVNIVESPDRPALIHGVQHVFHPPSWLARWPSDDRHSRIVFITRGVPSGWVNALLEALDAEVAAVSANSADSNRANLLNCTVYDKETHMDAIAVTPVGADHIEVPTARIGLIIPSVNRLSEPQFTHFAPPGLGIHVTRARIAGKWRKPVAELAPIIAQAAGALSDASPDLIVYHCTDSSMREGLDGERRILDIVRGEAGIEAVSTSALVVEALNALGIKKLVIVSPYQDNEVIIAYLQSCGFSVVHDVALRLPGHESSGAPPERWVETTLNNARDEADGYFLSCTNTTQIEAIEELEAALGKPVVSSNQAVLWGAVKRLRGRLGDDFAMPPLGRLMRL